MFREYASETSVCEEGSTERDARKRTMGDSIYVQRVVRAEKQRVKLRRRARASKHVRERVNTGSNPLAEASGTQPPCAEGADHLRRG